MPAQASNEISHFSGPIVQGDLKPVEINAGNHISSIAFLADGKLLVSGGMEETIRCWRVEDGVEEGTPMHVGSPIRNLTASRDGKWIVSGTEDGQVAVWDAEKHVNVAKLEGHDRAAVWAVDISSDSTQIASGSNDQTVCLWSFPTREQVHKLNHGRSLAAVKFSHDGCLVATAMLRHDSVRIYDTGDGQLLAEFSVRTYSPRNQSLVWARDSNQVFVLSRDGNIHTLDLTTKSTLSKWRIHSDKKPSCITLLGIDPYYIASSDDSSISFWDTKTHKEIGHVIEHANEVWCMAISINHDMAVAVDEKIIIHNLRGIHSSYQNASLREQDPYANEKIISLERTIQELRHQLSTEQSSSVIKITHLEESLRDHCVQLSNYQRKVNSLTQLLHVHEQKHKCEVLYAKGHIQDAADILAEIVKDLTDDVRVNNFLMDWLSQLSRRTGIQETEAQWDHGFRERCAVGLVILGDNALAGRSHNEAIESYSNALSLGLSNVSDVLVKRSRAYAATGLWGEALNDAEETIKLAPSSYQGYERRHAALHGMGSYTEAFRTFETMLLVLQQSSNSHIHGLQYQYMDITPLVRKAVNQTIHNLPLVLIDMTTGEICDRSQQAAAFEELAIFDELRSSMITIDQLDHMCIQREVQTFYRYVMLSHRWHPDEPTFETVKNATIYGLPDTSVNHKLKKFCEIGCSFAFRWAWSDTCCVNQADKGVQQESVVAMFRWYSGSSLTIVHLLGVSSDSQKPGCLRESIWNTRGWTYQEYVASKVVQFYTEDWKPYLGLDIFNHKESPLILLEMEQAMNIASQQLSLLRPGLKNVREKLHLASRRQTTREEDVSYSLFGIFDIAISIMYGEGSQALRRFLEHILTRSGDVRLLSWTGAAGSHYTYLPADLTVYDGITPPHIPQLIETSDMEKMVAALQLSPLDLSLANTLYEQLHALPPLSVSAGLLKLPSMKFPLTNLIRLSDSGSDAIYSATTHILGDVQIKTANILPEKDLFLIHPWISPLLDQDFSDGVPQCDLATRALRLLVRLRQPFGALLLAPLTRTCRMRVATDSLIMVQVRGETTLMELIDAIYSDICIQ